MSIKLRAFCVALAAVAVISALTRAQGRVPSTANGEWPSYHGDNRNHHYSPLAQIDGGNFNTLEVAWRFKTDNLGNRPEYKLEGTPLMVGGVLYTTAGTRRAVVALDAGDRRAALGARRARRRARARPRRDSCRAAASRTGPTARRSAILYVTPGFRLVALDADDRHARRRRSATDGVVDLKAAAVFGTGAADRSRSTARSACTRRRPSRSDVVIVGSAFREGHTPKTHNNTKGLVQAFDVRTRQAALELQHHSAARRVRQRHVGGRTPGRTTATSACGTRWPIDEELGLVYLPVETPTLRFLRRASARQQPVRREPRRRRSEDGQAASGTSSSCTIRSGTWTSRRRRSSKTSPSAGTPIKAVSIMGKQAMVYVFDRATGRAGVADRRAAGAAERRAGREDSPTQPFPIKPPPYDHQGVTPGQPDRLHAGASRRSGEADVALQDGTDLHAAAGQQGRGADRVVPIVGRHELAGRRVRSRDAGALRAVVHVARAGRADAAAEQGVLGHPLRARQRRHRRALHHGPWRERRRRCAAAASAAPRGGWRRRRRRRVRRTPQGLPYLEAAVRPHHRDRHDEGRVRLAGRARRDAGLRPQSPRAERASTFRARVRRAPSACWSRRRS